jgi:hypothetical protein
LKRDGREAFIPFTDPMERCPYKREYDTWRRMNWVEGWKEEERAHEERQVREQKEAATLAGMDPITREAFRAGWHTNAIQPDGPDYDKSYLDGCEEADWQEWAKNNG